MFILFAFIALSAAVEYNKAKYLITPEGKSEREVLVLNTCLQTKNAQFKVKYEPVSDTKYKTHMFPSTDATCSGTPTTTEQTLGTQGEEYVYADTLPTHIAHSILATGEGCTTLAGNSFTLYVDICSTQTTHANAQSEKIVKDNNGKLVKKLFSDKTCTTAYGTGIESYDEIGACGQCVESGSDYMSLKCEVKTDGTTPNTPSGGSTPAVDFNTAKYAIDKDVRVDRSVFALRQCSKTQNNKYVKAVGISATKYKLCMYTDDKCTLNEEFQGEVDEVEFVNELPKNIGYSVMAVDSQCATITDASFTIYVEGCIASGVIQGGTHEKAVIENGKLKIKSYTDNQCTKPNPDNLLQERDAQDCGKCKEDHGKYSAMKCQAYGSNGSIQTFVLFALTILLFLF